METARELELEVEPEDGTELLPSHDETWTDEELLLINEERKWFLEIESPSDEDAEKTVEMTTKDLEYYINLVVKAVAGLERTDSNFKRGSTVDKMLSNSTVCYREMVCERTKLIWQTSLLSYFKKLPRPPPPSATTILIHQQPSTSRQDPPPAKRLWLVEDMDDDYHFFFLAIKYF